MNKVPVPNEHFTNYVQCVWSFISANCPHWFTLFIMRMESLHWEACTILILCSEEGGNVQFSPTGISRALTLSQPLSGTLRCTMKKTVSKADLPKIKKNLRTYVDKITCSAFMDFPTKNNNNKNENKSYQAKIYKGCTKQNH